MPDRFLTRVQVAEELGVSPWVVYSLIRRVRLPTVRIRIGSRGWWRVSREDLEVYRSRPTK
jgi:excisionase family DNA binding protein